MARRALPVIAVLLLIAGTYFGWTAIKRSAPEPGDDPVVAASGTGIEDAVGPKIASVDPAEPVVAPTPAIESEVPAATSAPDPNATPTTPESSEISQPDTQDDSDREQVIPGTPQFDVVRVASDGQTVIAGTAQPNEEVEILLDGEVVGSATADDAGAFVTVIFAALSGDAQQLQLRVQTPDEAKAATVQGGTSGSEAATATTSISTSTSDADAKPPTRQATEQAAGQDVARAPTDEVKPSHSPGLVGEQTTPLLSIATDARTDVSGADREPAIAVAPAAATAYLGGNAGSASSLSPEGGDARTPDTSRLPQGNSVTSDLKPEAPPKATMSTDLAEPAETAPVIALPSQPKTDASDAASLAFGPATVPDSGSVASTLSPSDQNTETALVRQPIEATEDVPATRDAAAGLSDDAPEVIVDLAALAPVRRGDGGDSGSRQDQPLTQTGKADRTVSALPAPDATGHTPTVTTNLARPSAGNAPGEQTFTLSAPVIILPATEGGAAPTVVQPQADELALLQPGGGAVTSVTLDRISYGETGDVRMSGRGAPGRALRTYGNGLHLGSTSITGDGRWSLSLPREDVLAIKLFRFDEVDAAGGVTSRIETPFTYSSGPAQVLKEREVIVEKGDYLWRIAEQHYGEGLRYSLIYGANSELIRDPDLIYPGQVFSVPLLVDAE